MGMFDIKINVESDHCCSTAELERWIVRGVRYVAHHLGSKVRVAHLYDLSEGEITRLKAIATIVSGYAETIGGCMVISGDQGLKKEVLWGLMVDHNPL